uniref:Uncharacterized protein n=1 Tax=Ditylenchus dipsaci TaxID=166011 RepID=A0A915D2N4_9BILA
MSNAGLHICRTCKCEAPSFEAYECQKNLEEMEKAEKSKEKGLQQGLTKFVMRRKADWKAKGPGKCWCNIQDGNI